VLPETQGEVKIKHKKKKNEIKIGKLAKMLIVNEKGTK